MHYGAAAFFSSGSEPCHAIARNGSASQRRESANARVTTTGLLCQIRQEICATGIPVVEAAALVDKGKGTARGQPELSNQEFDMNNNNSSAKLAESVKRLQPEETVLPEPSDGFVITPCVEDITQRALTYLQAGYPVHFSGAAGTGKTTLAFHVAAQLNRPVSLIHGDDDFTSADLVGQDSGYRKHRLVDNYIHSVVKTEEEMKSLWLENRLTTACKNGDTLIYDEFNRSRPESNNPFLSIFSERILNLPKLRRSTGGYLHVHPEFRAIFTSNPEEYAGVHKTQDALMDRLITIPLDHYDRKTEIEITIARSKADRGDAEIIVDLVRELRRVGVSNSRPTIRACIAIARVLALRGVHARSDEPIFQWVCRDVLSSESAKVTRGGQSLMPQKVEEALLKGLRTDLSSPRNNSPRKPIPSPAQEGRNSCPLPLESSVA